MSISSNGLPIDGRQPIEPVVTTQAELDEKAAAADLAAMTATFKRDLADGRIGRRYNTYEHRARILRRMAAL